jgi:hypothetical protein
VSVCMGWPGVMQNDLSLYSQQILQGCGNKRNETRKRPESLHDNCQLMNWMEHSPWEAEVVERRSLQSLTRAYSDADESCPHTLIFCLICLIVPSSNPVAICTSRLTFSLQYTCRNLHFTAHIFPPVNLSQSAYHGPYVPSRLVTICTSRPICSFQARHNLHITAHVPSRLVTICISRPICSFQTRHNQHITAHIFLPVTRHNLHSGM